MPTEAVLMHLSSAKEAESLQLQVILQSAPVLKNVKMSCMFTVPAAYTKMVFSLFRQTDIKICCLCHGAMRDVVLVYREEQLRAYLENPQIAEFLKQFGYFGNSIESYLSHLGERISYYYNEAEGYPHEMGIFLGYPLEDVRGFMIHEGKNCYYTGYWKVYSDVEHAKKVFRTYDEAKDTAVMEFFSGKRVWEIAC